MDYNLIFDQYLYFSTIEELINKYYKEEKEQKEQEKVILKESEQEINSENLLVNKERIAINPIFTTRVQ